MAHYEHLPIYKKAFDMAVFIENTVRGFSRYHKYTLGTEMRNLSREAVQLIIIANSERERLATLERLRAAIEGLKITVRIGKETKAFKNFNAFVHLMEEIISLGKQCEGWIKSMRGQR
jgi:hypothetical protein